MKACIDCKHCNWEHPFNDDEPVVWCIRNGFPDEYKGYAEDLPEYCENREE